MRRTPQEIVELVVFGLIALLSGHRGAVAAGRRLRPRRHRPRLAGRAPVGHRELPGPGGAGRRRRGPHRPRGPGAGGSRRPDRTRSPPRARRDSGPRARGRVHDGGHAPDAEPAPTREAPRWPSPARAIRAKKSAVTRAEAARRPPLAHLPTHEQANPRAARRRIAMAVAFLTLALWVAHALRARGLARPRSGTALDDLSLRLDVPTGSPEGNAWRVVCWRTPTTGCGAPRPTNATAASATATRGSVDQEAMLALPADHPRAPAATGPAMNAR